MSNRKGTIHGVYHYKGHRVFRVRCESGEDIYLNDDFIQVDIRDEHDLQTITVMTDGELKSPWAALGI